MNDEFKKRYELLDRIGEGGLAVVIKIRRLDSAVHYAFKKLKDNSPINFDALHNEYTILSSCKHPGIPAVVEFIQETNHCGLICELVEGRPLQEYCGKLNDSELQTSLVAIFDIAAFIHHIGYIYNDYKPQNFIRRPDGSLKLIDFNLAQKNDSQVSNKCGTLEYLAPEIIRGGQVSTSSDIYSLGVMLYELIAGHLPFIAADQDGLLKAIAELPPLPLTGESARWNKAVQQLLAKNPTDRPQSIYEAADLFGLSSELDAAVKRNAEYYLGLTDANQLPSTCHDRTLVDILDRILKKYRFDDDWIACLGDWSGSDSKITGQYLLYLIKNDFIKFSARGWVPAKQADPSILPHATRDYYLRKLALLNQSEFEVLSWIALANMPLTIAELSDISESCPELIKACVGRLSEIALVSREKKHCRVINKSLALTILTQVSPQRQSMMHKRMARFLAAREPENHSLLAEHYSRIPDYRRTIDHGYHAAGEFLKNDNLKQTRHYLELALKARSALAENQIEPEKSAQLYLFAGDFAKRVVENKTAEKYYRMAAEYANLAADDKVLAIIYKNLGDLYRRNQRPNESIEYSQKALETFCRLGERSFEAACLNNISLAHWLNGDCATALEFLNRALKINEELNDFLEQSKIHSNIGFISDLAGNTAQVLRSFDKALECARKVGNHYQEMVSLNNIGFFHLNSGNPSKALGYFQQALEIAIRRNYVDQQLNMESNIAWAYHEMGNIIKSAEANQKTLDIALKNRHELFAAQSSYLLARDCLAMGNYRLADKMLIQARGICSDISNNDLAIDILLGQIELALATGDLVRAKQLLDDFSAKKNPGKKQSLTGKLYQARLLDLKRDNNAVAAYRDVINQVTETEFGDIGINAAIAAAEFCLGQNRLESASAFLAGIDTPNVLTKLRLSLANAELDNASRRFDNALEAVKAIKTQAEQFGCLPEYFRASLVELDIYMKCGKNANAMKALARMDKMYQSFQRSFPEDRPTADLANLPFFNRYLTARAALAEKKAAALSR